MNPSLRAAPGIRLLIIATIAMVTIVAVSNWLVQFPINDWLTWAAFTYPFAFLVTELTNRAFGPQRARQVAGFGFIVGVAMSFALVEAGNWRIPLASGGAFLVAQLLDVAVFNRLRRAAWWLAPLAAASLASTVDTAIFFSGAFAGTGLPWITWALGDLAVKLAMAICLLLPFRLLMATYAPQPAR